jgi:hypothetical protein
VATTRLAHRGSESSASPPRSRRPRPSGARYSPNTSRSTPAHSPVVTRPGALEGGRHEVLVGAGGLAQPVQRALHRLGIALRAPLLHRRAGRRLDRRVDGLDRGVEVGQQRVRLGRLERVDADDDLLAASIRRRRSASEATSCPFM